MKRYFDVGAFMKNRGFTLIELTIVIVIIAILSVLVAPRFIDFASDAKIKVIEQAQVSVKAANDLLYLKSKMPSYSVVQARVDLIDIDMDNDGDFDTIGDDKVDVRLKWSYLDNTDLVKRIDFSNDLSEQREGSAYTYIGYDPDEDGNVKEDNCYFKYTQASNVTTPPIYELITSGC